MSVTTQTFPSPAGDIIHVTLTNEKGASVTLSNLGAGIVSVIVPDKEGNMANVALGYKDPAAYMADGPCMGKVPGRYANRIAKGHFTLEGKEYSLAVNNGPNALHGGPTGFQNRLWRVYTDDEENSVTFTYTAADGEEGYPGAVMVSAKYVWFDDNTLLLMLGGMTDAPTVINLTNHAYFNLDGEDSGSVLDHELQLHASKWLPTDDSQIPTGELADVAGTPMDFTEPKKIGRDIHADFHALKVGKGYDHCWVVDDNEDEEVIEVAKLTAPKSGRTLTVLTDQPGMQIYTGNWLKGCPESISGHEYEDYDGVAIECQDFPDAPNHPDFPCTELTPGEFYDRNIVFQFGK